MRLKFDYWHFSGRSFPDRDIIYTEASHRNVQFLTAVFAAVAKCGVVENVLTWADFKQSKEMKKNDGAKRQRITGIPKLDDANDAGGKTSEQCTLILTEGDSAKALAVSFACAELQS